MGVQLDLLPVQDERLVAGTHKDRSGCKVILCKHLTGHLTSNFILQRRWIRLQRRWIRLQRRWIRLQKRWIRLQKRWRRLRTNLKILIFQKFH